MENITAEITEELKAITDKWKSREGNLIMVLHEIQKHYGFVPRNIAMFLAGELKIPLARIYEVITFYNYFRLEPPAEFTIAVCTGTACYLKGAPKIIAAFKKELNIPINGKYSPDKKYKVEEVRCIGCCGLAPAITVNEEVFGKVNPDNVKDILEKAAASKQR